MGDELEGQYVCYEMIREAKGKSGIFGGDYRCLSCFEPDWVDGS